MKKIRLIKIPLLALLLCITNINLETKASDINNFTVSFKNGTDSKYIKLINTFTNTKIKEKISDSNYVFTVDKALKNCSEKDYLYFLSMIPEIETVEPKINFSLKNKKAGDYVDGLILVSYKEGTSLKDIQLIDNKYGTKSVMFSKNLSLYQVKLPNSLTVTQAVNIFSKLTQVKYAEPDRVMKIQNKNNFTITFKENTEINKQIFENILDVKTKKLDKSYIFNVSQNYNSDEIINSLKISPLIMDIKKAN